MVFLRSYVPTCLSQARAVNRPKFGTETIPVAIGK
jgi:hypothetical protein